MDVDNISEFVGCHPRPAIWTFSQSVGDEEQMAWLGVEGEDMKGWDAAVFPCSQNNRFLCIMLGTRWHHFSSVICSCCPSMQLHSFPTLLGRVCGFSPRNAFLTRFISLKVI